ncbi:alpha/beta fold hydrolase [Bacillus sp. JCM 19041]|uniref:alpha/beta fold hydrolase n=1 Tax=Bacillus sp. JCM 19041 TaxID=1460637 RepID=UPI0006D164B5
MPLLDMPLSQLNNYMGRNPKPKDFDQYWESALRELDKVDPKVTLEKAEFQTSYAECQHLYFNSVNGARIYAKYVRPIQPEANGQAILLFHGYAGQSHEWSEMLKFVAAGASVFFLDVRGQSGRSVDPGGVKGNTLHGHIIRGIESGSSALFYRSVFLDTVQLARVVQSFPDVQPNRISTSGWSQGGALALACAALVPEIEKVATVYPFLSDYQRVWEMDCVNDAYKELKEYFRAYDPQHLQEAAFFQTLGYIDIQHLSNRVKAKVMMGTGLMDSACPPSTQFAVYNKLSGYKRIKIYPDFGHEVLPGMKDHIYQFLFCE